MPQLGARAHPHHPQPANPEGVSAETSSVLTDSRMKWRASSPCQPRLEPRARKAVCGVQPAPQPTPLFSAGPKRSSPGCALGRLMFSRQGQGLVTMSAWSQISNIISQFLCFQMKKLARTISRLPVNVDIYKDEQFINMCFFYGYIIIKQSTPI